MTAESKRRNDERGTALIELAFVALMLFSFSAAAIDFGLGWRSGLATIEAARAGARVGSSLGPQDSTSPDITKNGRIADFYSVSSAKAALKASGKLNQVDRIVVFQSTTLDGQPSAACRTGAGDTSCSVISGANLRTNWDAASDDTSVKSQTTATGCLTIANPRNFCPTLRVNTPQGSAQYLGVYVRIRHNYLFPILGSGTDVSRTAVMRIEPKAE